MFDVVVIGGGHAGTEAAAAAARCGASVALVTMNPGQIGAMSCNPAIGGLGKGHIVREIDALDGVMAVAADQAAIHYRMLNRSKGAAVRGPRVQADRRRYAAAVQRLLAALPTLTIVTGEVVGLTIHAGKVSGVELADDSLVRAKTVILATGTFMAGRTIRGREVAEGGRVNERSAKRLAQQLRDVGLPVDRLKTGTPPRLDGRTIDWAKLERQPSDLEPWTMSAMTTARVLPQVACAITRTNTRTHDMVRDNLDKSPLFTGMIDARGPRYCPSFEDKVTRFADRDSHQIFLEPEGLDDPIVYPNGLSTSLPPSVQQQLVRSIEGLEQAEIVVPGYAVEYDFIDPRALSERFAFNSIEGLYGAGQINGTTGYEEAAGQGLVAGLNAAAEALGRSPVRFDRASSYLGVMVDDLTLQGVTEPYRMLTARAEYRLALRADNADRRLANIGEQAGCVGPARAEQQRRRRDLIDAMMQHLSSPMTAREISHRGVAVSHDGSRKSIFAWLSGGAIELDTLAPDIAAAFPPEIVDTVVQDARYASYVERQAAEIVRLRQDEAIGLAPDLDYRSVPGLSNEMVERLSKVRPTSLGAAARVAGVTPAALSAILLFTRRRAA